MKKNVIVSVLLLALIAVGCSKEAGVEAGIIVDSIEDHTAFNALDSGYDLVEDLRKEEESKPKVDYSEIRDFCYDIYVRSAKDNSNFIMSPVSAYIAGSMAGIGSEGETRTEFYSVLGDNMKDNAAELTQIIPSDSLKSVNSVWIDDSFMLNDEYATEIKGFKNTDFFSIDLQAHDSVNVINEWISNNTLGKISDMLNNGLTDTAVLELFNVVYFNSEWDKCFSANNTRQADFTLEDGSTVKTDMMCDNRTVSYLSNDKWEGVVLPYKDSKYELVLLKDGTRKFSVPTAEDVHELLANTEPVVVDLSIPKFSFNVEIDLMDAFKGAGVNRAFDGTTAEMTNLGMSKEYANGIPRLYISDIKQKVNFTVDESGTEAAAATEVGIANMSLQSGKEVSFDEPFTYLLLEKEHEIPVFIGFINNPSE